MARSPTILAIVISAACVTACGESDSPSVTKRAATTSTSPETATTQPRVLTELPPSLGCDVVSSCVDEYAPALLDRCPESVLSAEGKEARRRLVKLLPRVDESRAIRAAAFDAYSDLDRDCRS